MRSWLVLFLVASALFAGCSQPGALGQSHLLAPGTETKFAVVTETKSSNVQAPAQPGKMTLRGVVVDEALHPLVANVTIIETHQSTTTGSGGAFLFTGLVPEVYDLTAQAAGHYAKTLSVTVESSRDELKFVLESLPAEYAYNKTAHFHGHVQCALEALIISPSCDSAVTFVGGPPIFASESAFLLPVDANWQTVVADVVFDPAAYPALDGVRLTVQGSHDQSSLGTYEQYGRFTGATSFTARIEPGGNYTEGVAPVPMNTTVFRFEAFPQSKLWHALCTPPVPGPCFLGVGFATDFEFDLYLTTFYVDPAPTDFTLR